MRGTAVYNKHPALLSVLDKKDLVCKARQQAPSLLSSDAHQIPSYRAACLLWRRTKADRPGEDIAQPVIMFAHRDCAFALKIIRDPLATALREQQRNQHCTSSRPATQQ
ncbi:unnamed protein product [Ectocarpus sp. 6 AP-2014]